MIPNKQTTRKQQFTKNYGWFWILDIIGHVLVLRLPNKLPLFVDYDVIYLQHQKYEWFWLWDFCLLCCNNVKKKQWVDDLSIIHIGSWLFSIVTKKSIRIILSSYSSFQMKRTTRVHENCCMLHVDLQSSDL